MNVLFLGGAKRVSMARMFVDAAARRGLDCRIYSYEISTRVPISIVAEVIVGLRWSDPHIYDHLAEVCRSRDIGVIVPFVDGAVAVAAEMARRHPGMVFAPTASARAAEDMFDKVAASRIFASHGLPIPATYAPGDSPTRLIAKPRHGSASKGIIPIDSEDDLARLLPHIDDYLVQQRIDNRTEYTVDCYVGVRSGEIAAVVPRERIEVSGGEVTDTITVDNPRITALAEETLRCLDLRGAVTIQVIHDLDTDRYMLMEINPRLGGGAVCAVHAGVDLPGLILDDAAGIALERQRYIPGTEIVRYPQEVKV